MREGGGRETVLQVLTVASAGYHETDGGQTLMFQRRRAIIARCRSGGAGRKPSRRRLGVGVWE